MPGDSISPRVVVLISADIEWQAVRQLYPVVTPNHSPFGEWFLLDLEVSGRVEAVIIFHGGWGKISAAASAQYVVDRWKPDLLINLGTCGGLAGAAERGEIILAERTVVYDIIEQMGDCEAHIAHYATDLDLSWLGDDYPLVVRRTLLVSGDRDLLAEDVPRLQEQYGAVAGDWESGAIAWVAARNQTRCLILRGVTDLVSCRGGEAYGNIELFAANARQVLEILLASLPAWIANARGLSAKGR